MTGAPRIVLTADRTLMSEYGGSIFLGFFACAPRGFIPAQDWFYFHFLCPSVPVDRRTGIPLRAPLGLRKIEAKLLEYGFSREEVAVVHPDYLQKVVGEETRALGITAFDPLGLGPITSTYVPLLGGKESYNMHKFRELMERRIPRHKDLRIIVGGPGSWQLLEKDAIREFGIDTVVIGEGEGVVGPLFKDALEGKPLPPIVYGSPVGEGDVPNIVGPTIHGLVEISRGCGRGCQFCEPTMRYLKNRSLEDILKEVRLNIQSGLDHVTLHSDDVFRYKALGLQPRQEAVEELFKAVCSVEGVRKVHVSHGAFASILSAPKMLPSLSEIMNLSWKNWRSYQVGLETGSPRLIGKYMIGKCKPWKPEEWPEVVIQAMGISNDAFWIPCSTILMGLPGETGDDVVKTLELLDDLKDYKTMFYPLFFVPLGQLRKMDFFTPDKMLPEHFELLLKCWEFDLKLWPRFYEDVSKEFGYLAIEKPLSRLLLKGFVAYLLRCLEDVRTRFRAGLPFQLGRRAFSPSSFVSLPSPELISYRTKTQ
ncbi:B12-binding domain-containing radical SAM protein [Candidatus Bathyarchaeota archaeon]|nr:B12-binding domain-containing radical SAM protein [Candidatus Bathyarchaeota archaeon]MBS7627513.1 B12-binding domain-containing radical SAM protein [Candidatus Bathyarchaeota archaeon]